MQKAIDSIVSQLVANYKPEKIILFGSAARGDMGPDSDVDLCVIKDTKRRFYDRISDVQENLRSDKAVDVLVYTPSEFNRLTAESWFVGEEIVKNGKIIYAV